MKKEVRSIVHFTLLFLLATMYSYPRVMNKIPATQSVQGSLSRLALDEVYELSKANQANPITRSQMLIPTQKTTNLYTQSQAHMAIPEVKNLIETTYNIKPYQKLINQMLEYEKKYDNEYVFYHGLDNPWRVIQDVYTYLYAYFNKISSEQIKDFIFMRFNATSSITSTHNFLSNEMKKSGLINDHLFGNDVIAANLAIFGNVGTAAECTWEYFTKSRGHSNPTRAMYEKIMDAFGLTHKYITELMSLVSTYNTKEQTILQIFIPKDKVDSIGYLSWVRGIPADQDIMQTVMNDVHNKKFIKTTPALDHYSALLKEEQEKNPLFKNTMNRIASGEFSLRYFLDFYRNRPAEIKNINSFQARLFLTPEVLLNPYSGVKIFRYSMATSAQLKKYKEKFDTIMKKIIVEKENK